MVAAAITTLALSTPAQAQKSSRAGGPFGFGIVLGDPSALTGRYNLGGARAVDGGLAFALDRWVLVYGDYLHLFPGAFGRQAAFLAQTTPYLGIGGMLVISSKSEAEVRKERYFDEDSSSRVGLGLRVPIGAEWRPRSLPIGVFLELAPGLTIFPGTSGFLQGGLGARFYF